MQEYRYRKSDNELCKRFPTSYDCGNKLTLITKRSEQSERLANCAVRAKTGAANRT